MTNDEVQDLHARISRVWVGRVTDEGVVPEYVESFYMGHQNTPMLRTYDRDAEEHKDYPYVEDEWLFECPQVGMVSDGTSVMYLNRIPERQWKMGYTNNVVRTNQFNHWEIREMRLPMMDVTDQKVLDFVYNPKYTSMADGLSSMDRGDVLGFPLSRTFAVSLKRTAKWPVLHYKEWTVGWVEDGVACLHEETQHLFEELSQYTECRRAV